MYPQYPSQPPDPYSPNPTQPPNPYYSTQPPNPYNPQPTNPQRPRAGGFFARLLSGPRALLRNIQNRLKMSDTAFRRLKLGVAAGLVVLVVVVGVLIHFVAALPYSAMRNRAIGAEVTVTGDQVPNAIKAVASKVNRIPFSATQPLGPLTQITPAGKLPAAITLQFKLSRPLKSAEIAIIATSESQDGPWSLIEPTISADRQYASVQTTHLSWWRPFWYDVGLAAGQFKKQILAGVSNELLNEATQPQCANEAKARYDSYYITSSAKDTLYWCFGAENNARVLKVVNRMRYPLEVSHPGLTVKSLAGPTAKLDQLTKLGSGQTTILYPFEEADFAVDLTPGKTADLRTTYSSSAQGVYQLEFGVTALINTLAWGRAEPAGIGSGTLNASNWIAIAQAMNQFLAAKDCASAVQVSDADRLFAGCFNADNLKRVFGWKGLLLAPITPIRSVVGFFRSEFNLMGGVLAKQSEYQTNVGKLQPYQGIAYTFANILPNGITAGPDGALWFTYGFQSTNGGGIGRITLGGSLKKYPLPASTSNRAPQSITKGSDGNLWFTIPGNVTLFVPDGPPPVPGQIGRITPSGSIKLFPATKSASNPVMVAPGPDGNIWFTDTDGSIGRITPQGQVTEFATGATPYGGIVASKDGNMWFGALGRIGKITMSGQVTMFTQDVCPNVSTCDLAVGPDNNFWFTDGGNGFIGRMSEDGRLTRFPVDNGPWAIAAGSDGALWFAGEGSSSSHTLGRISQSGAVTFPVSKTPKFRPSGLAVGPDGDLWLAGENAAGQAIIWRVAV